MTLDSVRKIAACITNKKRHPTEWEIARKHHGARREYVGGGWGKLTKILRSKRNEETTRIETLFCAPHHILFHSNDGLESPFWPLPRPGNIPTVHMEEWLSVDVTDQLLIS
jgi:hypothetical protein